MKLSENSSYIFKVLNLFYKMIKKYSNGDKR